MLDRGLKEHPGYLSALVAKGRCHLELGEPEPARTVLERVVKQDATQMVANKLLVRAYLDTGEPERARERLDLYTLLNDSDPEIEELRRRLRAMEQPPQARTPDPFQASDSSPFSQAAQAAPRGSSAPPGPPAPDGDIFDLGLPAPRRASADVFELDAPAAPVRPAASPGDPFADLLAPPPSAPAVPAALAVAEAPPAEPAEEPEAEDVLFPGLSSRDSRRRYLDNLGSEGIFLLDLTAAEPPAPAVFEEPWIPEEPEPVPPTEAIEAVEDEPTESWSPAPWTPESEPVSAAMSEMPEPEPEPAVRPRLPRLRSRPPRPPWARSTCRKGTWARRSGSSTRSCAASRTTPTHSPGSRGSPPGPGRRRPLERARPAGRLPARARRPADGRGPVPQGLPAHRYLRAPAEGRPARCFLTS